MIEFKGAYSNKATKESKSVLVQFDGVLLHIWQRTDPFCRLLCSDVFSLQPAFGKGKRYVKLPNGGRIETDDIEAYSLLLSSKQSANSFRKMGFLQQWQCVLWVSGAAFLAAVFILLHRKFF